MQYFLDSAFSPGPITIWNRAKKRERFQTKRTGPERRRLGSGNAGWLWSGFQMVIGFQPLVHHKTPDGFCIGGEGAALFPGNDDVAV